MVTSDSSQPKKSDKGKPHFHNPLKASRSTPPPLSPSSEKNLSFKRSGSFGKGSHKAPTTPRRPMLATEARSLVRPCHCGKDGVFKPHSHNHDHHHRVSITPERSLREPRGSRSPQVTRKSRGVTPPVADHHHHHQPKTPLSKGPSKQGPRPSSIPLSTPPAKPVCTPPAKPASNPASKPVSMPPTNPPKDDASNKFVSTVVWYPELDPEFNSTKVQLSAEDDATRCIDKILVKEYDSYIKKNFPHSDDNMNKLEEEIYTKHITTNNLISDFEGSLMQPAKATIS